jgi:transposase-like protein
MQPDVRKITIDFETALWKALRCLLPNVKLQGCVFHWTQAVWRKVSYVRKAASGELQKIYN